MFITTSLHNARNINSGARMPGNSQLVTIQILTESGTIFEMRVYELPEHKAEALHAALQQIAEMEPPRDELVEV